MLKLQSKETFGGDIGKVWKGREGLIVVPCLYINTFNEWKDKGDSPGRPVAIHTDPQL